MKDREKSISILGLKERNFEEIFHSLKELLDLILRANNERRFYNFIIFNMRIKQKM